MVEVARVMTQPKTPPLQAFNPDNIPESLTANARWAPWKAVWSEKRQKYDKIPHLCLAPYYGISTAKPDRWGTFAQALKAYNDNPSMFAGLGYVMTNPHGVIAIDLDNCVQDNTIADWAREIIDRADSYTELSPSGKGLRIMALGEIPNDWTNHEIGIEVYAGHQPRFLTITGQKLKVSRPGVSAPGAEVFSELSTRYAKSKTTATVISMQLPDILDEMVLPSLDSLPLSTSTVKFLTTGETSGDRSLALFAAAIGLYNAGLTDEEVFSMLALNPFTMEVALDHRRQDSDRALMYLWVESCQKGKAKSTPVAGLADFENLAPPAAPIVPSIDAQYAELTGSVDDFDDCTNEALAPIPSTPAATQTIATKINRFGVQPLGSFAGGKPLGYLIKGLLPKAEIIVLYGESGSGKSFMALDLGMAMARGIPWRGLRVKQGRQVYIAAEGAGGFRNRVNAYARHHGISLDELNALGEHFGVISAAPNFMIKDDVLEVCKEILVGGPVAVVWVDTWAQVLPGANENAGEDIGKALQHCKGIHKATGAVVILVHHSGKDASKGARGWSGLKAAADAELEVSRMDTGRKLKASKQKDGQDGLEWGFDLPIVGIGTDEDGDVITSCVVSDIPVPEKAKGGAGANKGDGPWGGRAREALTTFALAQSSGIERKAVLEEMLRLTPPDDRTPNSKKVASAALKKLLADPESGFSIDDDDGGDGSIYVNG